MIAQNTFFIAACTKKGTCGEDEVFRGVAAQLRAGRETAWRRGGRDLAGGAPGRNPPLPGPVAAALRDDLPRRGVDEHHVRHDPGRAYFPGRRTGKEHGEGGRV